MNHSNAGPEHSSKQKKSKQKKSRPKPTEPRPVYLAGESFGGILAAEVALSILSSPVSSSSPSAAMPPTSSPQPWLASSMIPSTSFTDGSLISSSSSPSSINLKGLALINAATCYDRSKLAAEGPIVADLHPWLYNLGLLRLLPLFTDDYSLQQLRLILQSKALPSVIDTAAREAYMGRVAFSLPFVIPFLPQETLKWRLTQWLDYGCARMASRLVDFRKVLLQKSKKSDDFGILIVAGEKDGALPSIAEAERLANVLPNVGLLHVVEGAGHASTCGSRVDLAALFRKCFPGLRPRGILGGGLPWQRVGPAATASTDDSGRTAMKKGAAAGKGAYFGMEPRYDNATIGLNPLLYWSSRFYRKAPSVN